jgi:transglutaminase-like putative cysteine protease
MLHASKVPVDVVVSIRGMTRIKARGVPIDINELAVAVLPAVEIPARIRLEAKIDILGNLLRGEWLITGRDTTWMDRIRNGWARLRGILSRGRGPR